MFSMMLHNNSFLQGVQGLKFVVNTIKSHFLNTIRSFVYFSQMKYIDYAFSLSKNGIEQTLDLLLKMTSNLTTYWDYLSLNLMHNFNILFHFFFTISSSRKNEIFFYQIIYDVIMVLATKIHPGNNFQILAFKGITSIQTSINNIQENTRKTDASVLDKIIFNSKTIKKCSILYDEFFGLSTPVNEVLSFVNKNFP